MSALRNLVLFVVFLCLLAWGSFAFGQLPNCPKGCDKIGQYDFGKLGQGNYVILVQSTNPVCLTYNGKTCPPQVPFYSKTATQSNCQPDPPVNGKVVMVNGYTCTYSDCSKHCSN